MRKFGIYVAFAAALLVALAGVFSFIGGDAGPPVDRNVPGATTPPGKSSLAE